MSYFPQRCQHLKVNGTQCGCPALRRNQLCFFHKRHHDERVQLNLDRLKNGRRRPTIIDLPVLEDANSIQVSLMQIMRLIVTGQIDGKTAGLLLYALQTASANLARTNFEPFRRDVVLDPKAVAETPLGSYIWDDDDFYSDQQKQEAARPAALAEAQRQARKQADADLRAKLETEIRTEAARREAAARNQPPVRTPEPPPEPAAQSTPPAAKRPNAKVNMNEVRKKVTAQIIQALPAIAAAQLEKRNGARSG